MEAKKHFIQPHLFPLIHKTDLVVTGNENMGLPMNDIHSPTVVPSGPTSSASASNGAPQQKVPLMNLIAEKSRVEEELKALGSVLDSVCCRYLRFIMTIIFRIKMLRIVMYAAQSNHEHPTYNIRRLPSR